MTMTGNGTAKRDPMVAAGARQRAHTPSTRERVAFGTPPMNNLKMRYPRMMDAKNAMRRVKPWSGEKGPATLSMAGVKMQNSHARDRMRAALPQIR